MPRPLFSTLGDLFPGCIMHARHRKPMQQRLTIIAVLCTIIAGSFAAYPLFTSRLVTHAAATATLVSQINVGGPAINPFAADTDFTGGLTAVSRAAVNTSGVSSPAPQAVYQSYRYGNFSYTLPKFTPGASYTVRLDFAEMYWKQAGRRIFNVSANGRQVLSNFDILATAGRPKKAVTEQFPVTADGSGTIVLRFTKIRDNAQVNGIEVLSGDSTQMSTAEPTSTVGVPTSSGNFGPSVYIFNPSMPQSKIQVTVDAVAKQQVSNQFGPQRYALLFEARHIWIQYCAPQLSGRLLHHRSGPRPLPERRRHQWVHLCT